MEGANNAKYCLIRFCSRPRKERRGAGNRDGGSNASRQPNTAICYLFRYMLPSQTPTDAAAGNKWSRMGKIPSFLASNQLTGPWPEESWSLGTTGAPWLQALRVLLVPKSPRPAQRSMAQPSCCARGGFGDTRRVAHPARGAGTRRALGMGL